MNQQWIKILMLTRLRKVTVKTDHRTGSYCWTFYWNDQSSCSYGVKWWDNSTVRPLQKSTRVYWTNQSHYVNLPELRDIFFFFTQNFLCISAGILERLGERIHLTCVSRTALTSLGLYTFWTRTVLDFVPHHCLWVLESDLLMQDRNWRNDVTQSDTKIICHSTVSSTR